MSHRREPPTNQQLNDALERFDELMAQASRESDFQQLFADCPYILSRTLPLQFEASDVVPLGRVGKAEPDFLVFPSEGRPLGHYGIIEIKRPDSKLFVRPPRVGTIELASDVRTAIAQSRLFEEQLLPGHRAYTDEHVVMLGNRSDIFIIGGLSRELAAAFSSELYIGQLNEKLPHNCELIPYDSLLKSFRATVPPRLMSLRPGVSVETREAPFNGLRSTTILAAQHPSLHGFSCGKSTRWEQEINMIVAGLYAGDRPGATVRITENVEGELVGVSASEASNAGEFQGWPSNITPPKSSYIAVLGLSERYRGFKAPDGARFGDVVLHDALSDMAQTGDGTIPGVFALVSAENSPGKALARRRGFEMLMGGQDETPGLRDDLMFRPPNLHLKEVGQDQA